MINKRMEAHIVCGLSVLRVSSTTSARRAASNINHLFIDHMGYHPRQRLALSLRRRSTRPIAQNSSPSEKVRWVNVSLSFHTTLRVHLGCSNAVNRESTVRIGLSHLRSQDTRRNESSVIRIALAA